MGKHIRTATRLIARSIGYYSIVTGVSTVRFNFVQGSVIRSRWLPIYATCMNVAVVISLPFAQRAAGNLSRKLTDNWLVQLTDGAYVAVHLSAILLTILLRWKRERRAVACAQEIFALDRGYFGALPPHGHIERRFAVLLTAKAITMIGQMATSAYTMLQLTNEVDALTCVLAVYFINTKYMLHGVMFHYFACMCHASRRLELLNAQLGRMLQQLEAMPAPCHANSEALQQLIEGATAQLQLMSQMHWRLTRLVKHLCDNHILQTLAVLLSYTLYTITFGYFSVLIMDGSIKLAVGGWTMPLGAVSYSVLLADLYVFYRVCHVTTSAYQQTVAVLKGFQALPFISVEFEHCCERFSLQLAQRPLNISMSGMFDLNLQSLLALWAYILRHTVILVQFDLENRMRQSQDNVT